MPILLQYCILPLGDVSTCAEEQLRVPGNGSVNCVQRTSDLKCTLTCENMFKFGASADFSPQYCRDGVWDYQEDEVDIPDCERECIHCHNTYINDVNRDPVCSRRKPPGRNILHLIYL